MTTPLAGPQCRNCGCTDDDCYGSWERTGDPCYWAEADLCSACQKPVDADGYRQRPSDLYVPAT